MIATILDLRSALRALAKRKASSSGALLIVAIAIGSNIAIAGVIDALILRPLPVREADRLVVPQGLQKDTGFNGSLRDLQAWRQARSFEAVAGVGAQRGGYAPATAKSGWSTFGGTLVNLSERRRQLPFS